MLNEPYGEKTTIVPEKYDAREEDLAAQEKELQEQFEAYKKAVQERRQGE